MNKAALNPIKMRERCISIVIIVIFLIASTLGFTGNSIFIAANLQGGSKVKTFSNPIILSEIPDPDVIRVGSDYYMVSTTMHMTPGVPIMHSKDLANWKIVGYVYDILDDNDAHNLQNGMNIYGKGQWAPCIRYYKGKFYVLFGCLDTGKTYLFSSKNITGPWERVEFNEYLHDPSLLFDDNGKAYIIYGGTQIRVKELTSDLKAINPTGLNKTIITSQVDGLEEGSHAYKINGKYYITTIRWRKGGIREVCVYRSNKIDGPYEGRLALSDTMGYKQSGVAQGGFVDTPDSKWYAMLFQDHDAVGRVPVLVPVKWENGWPVFGDKNGKVPLKINIETKTDYKTEVVSSDEFYQEKPVMRRFELKKENIKTGEKTLIINNDFAKGTVGWKARDGAKLEIVKENNKNIVRVYNRTKPRSGIQQNLTGKLEKGKRYAASFKIKYIKGAESCEFILTAKITSGNKESYIKLVKGYANKNQWTCISGTFEIEQGFDTIVLFIQTEDTEKPDKEKNLMDFYIDSVSVKEVLKIEQEDPQTAPNGSLLKLTWQWNHNPDNTKWSLLERKGFLRLKICSIVSDIQQARNTLTQRTVGPKCSGWILMDTRNMADGDVAGLAALQKEYGFVGVKREGDNFLVVMVNKGEEIERKKLEQEFIYIKIDFDFDIDTAYFYYSYDGINWVRIGNDLFMRYTIPHFMGYRFAIFNFATKKLGGYIDIDFFRFENKLTGEKTTESFKVYTKESKIELDNDTKKEYKVTVCVNAMPSFEQPSKITAILKHQPEIEIKKAVIKSSDLKNSSALIERTAQGTVVKFKNVDIKKIAKKERWTELFEISFTQKTKLTKSTSLQISIDKLIVESSKSISYGSDSAMTNLNYTAPKQPVGKIPPNNNPLISHKFGADPAVLVYGGRVYMYLTNDILEYDENGNVKDNSYSKINKITVISSDDLVNWTDHGEIEVAGPNGVAKWANFSWAPAVAHKKINGKDKFFLYFGNSGGGIGVITADTPIGPWEDPLGRPLITWSTPGVPGVVWLFDPAVLVDDDGKAYLYFGGGVPQGQEAMPNTARVIQLGSDMISVVGSAVTIPAPYMFEDSGINKIGGIYYYSYCTNFAQRPQGAPPAGAICYMTTKSPMGPWEYRGVILKNPGVFFGVGGNNHHQLFEFGGRWYIAYHAQTLAKDLGVAKGYRSPHINEVKIENGVIKEVTGDYKGVVQVKNFDPYRVVEAETFAWCAGVETRKDPGCSNGMCLTGIDSGDWVALSKVDFKDSGASKFIVNVLNVKAKGTIEVRLDSPEGEKIAEISVQPSKNSNGTIQTIDSKVVKVMGVHDVYFVFKGEDGKTNLFEVDSWKFER